MDNNEHPVVKLIKKRNSIQSTPYNRIDGNKLGLVIEGGGMRGVVSSAMASALHFLDLVDVFDAVYGSSAGAFNGSFFITYKMPLGPTIYYDNLNNNNFIDLKRAFIKNKPIMNLDYLLHDILEGIKPLNWQGVINSKIPLKIVVSSIKKHKAICFDKYNSKEELFTLLKASSNIPFVAGPPIKYHDDLLFDATVYESIPFNTAIIDGCTHILVLLTRPKGQLRGKPSFFEKYVITRKMNSISHGLGLDYLHRSKKYKKDIDFLLRSNNHFTKPPYLYSIYLPENIPGIARLEKNRNKLVQATIEGMRSVMNIFAEDNIINYQEVVYPFNKLGLIPKAKG